MFGFLNCIDFCEFRKFYTFANFSVFLGEIIHNKLKNISYFYDVIYELLFLQVDLSKSVRKFYTLFTITSDEIIVVYVLDYIRIY
ncbi:MAG: hypothetical protein COB54_04620 [Alphaproteobacteria bacterium]|nr:MAG: hypothetical protein COB54_04620 [Alphaproteobacteria bacterium]